MANNNRFARILLRGGTRDELKNINPMLREREPIVEYDTGKMKIGDGINRYNKLRYVGQSTTPTITSFTISKCYDTDGNVFSNGNVSDNSTIKTIIFKYKISSSPDKLLIYYDTTEEVFRSLEFPEKLEDEYTLDNIEIKSDSDNKKFILKIESIDGSPTSSVQINFQPYIYYGHGSIDDIKRLITNFNASECSKKLISSTENDIKDIDCSDTFIYFFLPASKYDNGAKFKDITDGDGIGWGGFLQLCKNGETIGTPDDIDIPFEKDEFIMINGKKYYIYRSDYDIGSKTSIKIDKLS